MHAFDTGVLGRGLFFAATTVALLTVTGCGRRNAPSDAPLARQSLVAALESWKAGDPPSKLRESAPAITMVDPAWEAGRKLESFEVVGPEVGDGVNVICPVKLVCKDEQGNTLTSQIKYIVSTSPAVTIFRHRSSY
jgi:hypothetical protein